MTEEEARLWVRSHFGVSRETLLAQFDTILRREAARQNLIAASTLDVLWARHLVDSAQLAPLAADAGRGAWVDVGSGAGLPGLVVAILLDRPIVLVEPRAKRVAFLREATGELGLEKRVTIQASRIETYHPINRAAVISARAVSELSQLLASTQHCTDSSTLWLLPKGRNAHSEVEDARLNWQGSFHVEPSITQPDSGIVIAQGVRPR
jgi:16S rRNA (guanine527-N7)-methyltransferase